MFKQDHWYAVQTRSNFENIVTGELASKNLAAYCPAVKELHQWADRRKVVERPLFPGYTFARFADTPEIRLSILKTTGIVRILGMGNRIEPVPDEEVDSIRRLLKSGRPAQTHPLLREGSRVRVRRGALKGLEGLLIRHKGQTRLVLTVNVLCRSVTAEVNEADVEVISNSFRPTLHDVSQS